MPPADFKGLPSSLAGALFHPWTWRMAWRDSRAQRRRLIVFALSIVSGIAALVAIHSLKATLEEGIGTQAKALLGSDLQVTSRAPFEEEQIAAFTARARRISQETSFSSMLYSPGADTARLVQVRGISGDYPFYGEVETSPPGAWAELRTRSGVILEPTLLDQFHAKVGDKVRLGSLDLQILGTMIKPPPRSSRFSGFAPEAYVRYEDLERTGLMGASSLAFHHLHLEVPDPAQVKEIRQLYRGENLRYETPEGRRESLTKVLDHLQQFLGIVALVALVLGAIGVAGAIHAHIARRVPTVAILRCLGCPGNLAFGIYLAQVMALGAIGAVLGAAFGMLLHGGTIFFFRDQLPFVVSTSPVWGVVARSTAAGLAVCCGFALIPLLRVRRIGPSATLRDGISEETSRWAWLRAWPVYLLLIALLSSLAVLNSASWKRALSMTGGLLVAFVVLAATAKGLAWLARRSIRPAWPYLLRQGISNLYRPRNQTLLFLLSLGLGTFLLLTILLTRNLLLERLKVENFAESPNLYLVDVQPDQVEGVEKVLGELQLPVLQNAPMITMRIQSVKGVTIRELPRDSGTPRWVLQREYRSTYRDHLTASETLIAGAWVAKAEDSLGTVPVSLEEEIAKDLKVGIGDEIVLNVQGVPITAKVTSIRKVDWSRFNLNFFMVFPPGVLEGAPGFNVLTTRIPDGSSSGELQRRLVQEFPNISAIDLTLILETVRSILSKVELVVQILAGFTLAAGLLILTGTLLNGRDQRVRESVLLRTLGASGGQVRWIFIIEYAALGTLSALSGVLLAAAANAALAVFVFEGSPWPSPALLAGALAGSALLSVLAGLALSRGVCTHPPLEILRSNG